MKIIHKLLIISLPLLLVGLLACTQDEEFTTHVSGKVVNRFSQEPIKGAYIYLKDGVGASGGFTIDTETSSDKRSEGYTDINGEFALEITGEFQPALGISKEGYEFDPNWNDGVGVGIKLYSQGGDYENQVLEMQARAGFNPVFKSIEPVTSTDSLIILFQDSRPDLPANKVKNRLNTGWSRLYIGQQTSRFISVDTPELEKLIAPTTGDTYTDYQIAYTRNSQWESKIDSVYIKSLEVYTDTIYY